MHSHRHYIIYLTYIANAGGANSNVKMNSENSLEACYCGKVLWSIVEKSVQESAV